MMTALATSGGRPQARQPGHADRRLLGAFIGAVGALLTAALPRIQGAMAIALVHTYLRRAKRRVARRRPRVVPTRRAGVTAARLTRSRPRLVRRHVLPIARLGVAGRRRTDR